MVRPGMLCKPTKVAAASCQALLPEFNHSGDGSSMSFLLRQVVSDRLNFLNCERRVVFAYCFLILATLPAPHGHERQNSDKSPAPTLPIKRSSKRCANSSKPEKVAHLFRFRHAPTF